MATDSDFYARISKRLDAIEEKTAAERLDFIADEMVRAGGGTKAQAIAKAYHLRPDLYTLARQHERRLQKEAIAKRRGGR